jgi:metal-responsive CopG/Arc/MetJ family transcriptional regulator
MLMRVNCTLTLPHDLVEQIDKLRGREKRSTFVEHLLRLGLKAYTEELNETMRLKLVALEKQNQKVRRSHR